jgi:hypothetical protein
MSSMRRVLRSGVLAMALALTPGTSSAQRPPDVSLEELLALVRQTTNDLLDKFSSIVAEERYVQDSNSYLRVAPIPSLVGRRGAAPVPQSPNLTAKHRELRADILIVRLDGDLVQPFRDVFEVDGFAIRDREQRLAKLFLDRKLESQARAREIANESARYNLGSIERTMNNPLFPLVYLRSDVPGHVRFTIGKSERVAGVELRLLEYIEEGRPTFIQGRPGQDMPAFGRYWIDGTGRVVKAELRIERREVKANLTTEFRPDDRLGINVPAQMRESYELLDSTVRGLATYSRFRRFGVESTEELTPPAPPAETPR